METILIFLAVLVLIVIVHEAGHAIAARLIGCRVEEFGIGFPPKLFTKRIGETLFSFNALPLGGFVRITGEDGENQDDPRSFAIKPRWQRIVVLLAGVAMNLVLAVVLFGVIAGVGTTVPVPEQEGIIPVEDVSVVIVGMEEREPLLQANIAQGDAILAVEGEPVVSSSEVVDRIRAFTGTELSILLLRNGVEHETTVIFPEPKEAGEPVGIMLSELGTYQVPWHQTPIEGVRRTGQVFMVTINALGDMLGRLIMEREAPEDIMGPVGIASVVGMVSKFGFLPLMELTAVISVNLALINALPIPALDGGRVLFVLLETVGIRRFRGNPERIAHVMGFMFLILLILLVTVQDIQRLFSS